MLERDLIMAISKKQAELDARYAAIQGETKVTESPKPRVGMSSLMDYTGNLRDAKEKLGVATAKLEILEKGKVQIADLHEVDGRKRTLKAEAFEELKANLANNPLANSIVVRTRKEGGYEIISGHNRVQAYRELGRVEIEADIREFDDEQVFEAAFYSNLINSQLSDYEKYLGFKQIVSKTGESQKDLASRAGVVESTITNVMSFDKLTPKSINEIAKNPHLVSAKFVYGLAKLDPSKAEEAIAKRVVNSEATDQQIMGEVIGLREGSQTKKNDEILIMNSNKIFARIDQAIGKKENKVVITFPHKYLNEDFIRELKELLGKHK